MKKLHRIRYLLATAFFLHAAVFAWLEIMLTPTDPLLVQSVTLPFHLPPPKRHGDEARQVLKEYMDMHSVKQLQRECPTNTPHELASLESDCPDLFHRHFAVGFYSCPSSVWKSSAPLSQCHGMGHYYESYSIVEVL